jgi:polysaccharide transporter, PST family
MSSTDPTNDEDYVPPLSDRLLKGSAVMIGMRWCVRLLGLISTAILARLLMPEDFGVIGLAIILVGFIESLTDVGVVMALIQNSKAERRHYDSAWTLQIGQSTVIAAIVLICAPFSGEFFGDDRVPAVLVFSAAAMFVQGFLNIGIADFRKKLMFEKDFAYTAISRAGRAVITIGFAFWLRSYWAIAYGNVVGALFEVCVSYLMSPFRPRLSTKAIRELWSFSQWMLGINIIMFLLDRGERFVVGRAVSASMFGYYTVGYDLAMMPTAEIVMPVVRAVDASVALIKDDAVRLRGAILKLLSAVLLFALPAGLGFLMVARECVTLVLGENWLPALPIVEAAAIAAVVVEIPNMVLFHVLIRAGYIRGLGILMAIQMVVLLGAIYPVYELFGGLPAVIYAKAVIAAVAMIAMMIMLSRHTRIRFGEYVSVTIAPVIATAAMMVAVYFAGHAVAWSLVPTLVFKVAVGGMVYGVVILALWFLRGRPDGIEEMAWDKATGLLGRFR